MRIPKEFRKSPEEVIRIPYGDSLDPPPHPSQTNQKNKKKRFKNKKKTKSPKIQKTRKTRKAKKQNIQWKSLQNLRKTHILIRNHCKTLRKANFWIYMFSLVFAMISNGNIGFPLIFIDFHQFSCFSVLFFAYGFLTEKSSKNDTPKVVLFRPFRTFSRPCRR